MNQGIRSISFLTYAPSGSLTQGEFKAKWWHPLPEEIIERVKGKSWKDDCPVPLKDLAYIQVIHWNFKKETVLGELVYHKNLCQEIGEIFKELFQLKFPIEKMVLIDDYNANDDDSMKENNSSAFCSRAVTGRPGVFSKHSYGGCIDLNPIQNPYVKGETILPEESKEYCDRSKLAPGMINKDDPCYAIFTKKGYAWGGDWKSLKDYQHFEKDPKDFI